jgi:predicted AAA+ superfamily ATPase
MTLYRKAFKTLINWKNSDNRKPLIIRGARQVGKTTLVRNFASEFDQFIELNLEIDSDRRLFEIEDLNSLINAILLLRGLQLENKPTLLFIDEIQESPKAIQKLRYFFEERPDIFLIAAGSLLEFALKDVLGFPVGRVSYLYLNPLCFEEYLTAKENRPALAALDAVPVPDYAHQILLDNFHAFSLVGGMPEVVKQYVLRQDIASLAPVYKELWQSFKDDAKKYASNRTEGKVISHIIETAPHETDRIKFEGFGKSSYRSREVGEAIRALDQANIIRLLYPSTSLEPPIISDFRKRPRLQFIDTGLLNQILNLQGQMLGIPDLNNFYRGKIIQHMVTQEIISLKEDERYTPHFWVREEKGTSSEVDLVYQYGKYIIPVEVKSGKQGKLRSLHQFMERTNHPYAIRLYAGTFSIENAKTPGGVPYLLMNLPYYLTSKLPEYIQYFMNQ